MSAGDAVADYQASEDTGPRGHGHLVLHVLSSVVLQLCAPGSPGFKGPALRARRLPRAAQIHPDVGCRTQPSLAGLGRPAKLGFRDRAGTQRGQVTNKPQCSAGTPASASGPGPAPSFLLCPPPPPLLMCPPHWCPEPWPWRPHVSGGRDALLWVPEVREGRLQSRLGSHSLQGGDEPKS